MTDKHMRRKEIQAALLLFLALAVFCSVFSSIALPKRRDFGSTWSMYLEEERNSLDVLFFGSSMAYCDVVPALIWEGTGLRSYVMAGPEQTLPINYYYIRECCRTQSPRLIFLEVTGVYFARYKNYTDVNIGYMPWTLNRLQATFRAAERTKVFGLLCPLYNYHSRWSTLTAEDFTVPLMGDHTDDLAGYTFLSKSTAVKPLPPAEPEADAETVSENLAYLQKIADFCSERGIELVFYIAPNDWQRTAEEVAALREAVEGIQNTAFLDFNDGTHSLGLDPDMDFFDVLHLNCRGAEKFSAWLGKFITDTYALKPAPDTDTKLWTARLQAFHALCIGAEIS